MVGDSSSGEQCWPEMDVESGMQVMPVAAAQWSGVHILSIAKNSHANVSLAFSPRFQKHVHKDHMREVEWLRSS
ncbi:hypothetical protein PAXRUDRAFT_832247 [Paxillus rubicundulus Ve08.2h10]|uniref:Uncharacterized protein n=1 Tax=Paxillus rubicundulus Ve08.2h10 TaxID=930991 RepID=A0A0D0DKW3_9AGAM|nr:hypothetical protein PAXRUDRAFT_832247 [Paxillus rubicundulus Ve08.2h10]